MESLSAGSFVGSGSFRCQHCGYALTLDGTELLTDCPACGGREFLRASMFKTERGASDTTEQAVDGTLVDPVTAESAGRLDQARAGVDHPGSIWSTRRAANRTPSR